MCLRGGAWKSTWRERSRNLRKVNANASVSPLVYSHFLGGNVHPDRGVAGPAELPVLAGSRFPNTGCDADVLAAKANSPEPHVGRNLRPCWRGGAGGERLGATSRRKGAGVSAQRNPAPARLRATWEAPSDPASHAEAARRHPLVPEAEAGVARGDYFPNCCERAPRPMSRASLPTGSAKSAGIGRHGPTPPTGSSTASLLRSARLAADKRPRLSKLPACLAEPPGGLFGATGRARGSGWSRRWVRGRAYRLPPRGQPGKTKARPQVAIRGQPFFLRAPGHA